MRTVIAMLLTATAVALAACGTEPAPEPSVMDPMDPSPTPPTPIDTTPFTPGCDELVGTTPDTLPDQYGEWLWAGLEETDFKDNHSRAITILSNAIELSPATPDAYFYRGKAYVRIESAMLAIDDLTCAIDLADTPVPEEFHYYLAKAYCIRAEFKDADDQFGVAGELRAAAQAAGRNSPIAEAPLHC